MDKDHSRLIVILLAGILFVLLFGREAAIGALGSGFWVLLMIGSVIAIIWMIIAAIVYARKEVKVFRNDLRRAREEGQPWLWTYILGPGVIGNFAVVGFAAFRYFFDNECRAFRSCLEQIPFWWLPVALMLLSLPILGLETVVLRWRQPRL